MPILKGVNILCLFNSFPHDFKDKSESYLWFNILNHMFSSITPVVPELGVWTYIQGHDMNLKCNKMITNIEYKEKINAVFFIICFLFFFFINIVQF